MSTTYLFPQLEDDNSDTLSSNGTKSTSLDSLEEPSPHFAQLSEVCDMDSVSNPTKKIRKKRCAYDKIDDEKRIKLLEAVQKNGESLKSASQRLQINYSSAKSILHTFRKEGRILKKSPLENTTRPYSMTNLPSATDTSPMNFRGRNAGRPGTVVSEHGSPNAHGGPNSPMRGLTSIFANLAIDGEEEDQETGIMSILKQEVQRKEEDTVDVPELQIPNFMSEFSVNFSIGMPIIEDQALKIPCLVEVATNELPICPMLSDPKEQELIQELDNFYMRYSNSPLSGGKGMFMDCSDSGSRRYCGEFESFSEMMNAFQTKAASDETKIEFGIPSFGRFNSSSSAQEKSDLPLSKQNSSEAGFMKRSGGFGSYLAGDSQWLICDTLKKASFLNSLIDMKRSGSSMRSEH